MGPCGVSGAGTPWQGLVPSAPGPKCRVLGVPTPQGGLSTFLPPPLSSSAASNPIPGWGLQGGRGCLSCCPCPSSLSPPWPLLSPNPLGSAGQPHGLSEPPPAQPITALSPSHPPELVTRQLPVSHPGDAPTPYLGALQSPALQRVSSSGVPLRDRSLPPLQLLPAASQTRSAPRPPRGAGGAGGPGASPSPFWGSRAVPPALPTEPLPQHAPTLPGPRSPPSLLSALQTRPTAALPK